MASLEQQIEIFLRNAVLEKRTEDRMVKKALADLRPVLSSIENLIKQSGAASLGPNRNQVITAVVDAVGRIMQQEWGIPMLGKMQEDLAGYVTKQYDFARKMVDTAGGTLANPGAADALNKAQMVNNATVAGKPLSAQLTSRVPALVADRVERYVRSGLSNASGDVFATYGDAVVTITNNNVEAIIRSGVRGVGSAAQEAIYAVETDPEWMNANGLIWTAVLDSRVCPICMALDGNRYSMGKPGPYWNGGNKVDPHYNCRCYMLPSPWREDPLISPTGKKVEPTREAVGDDGEKRLDFSKSARSWVKANPDTAKDIFGVKLGQQLVDGKIGFDKAVKMWRSTRAGV
jgi:hypothetical protein